MFEVLIGKPSKKLESLAESAGFSKAYFIDQKKFIILDMENKEELRREISRANSKGQKIIIVGASDEINRIAVSDKRVSMLIDPETSRNKDYMHQRSSGLNHVLCKLAVQNNVAIGISLDSMKKAKGTQKAEKIGRIIQNIEICRKYKTPIVLASFGKKPSDPYVLRSLGLSLGMTTNQAKESLENAEKVFGL